MDDFDRLAKVRRDIYRKFRVAGLSYKTIAEREANIEKANRQHIDALARFMREGGSVAEFGPEAAHMTGGSVYGWPVELAMAFADKDGQLSGKQCWDIVLHCSGMPPARWPGTASDIESPAIAKKEPKKPRGRPKGSGSLEKADAPILAKMKDGLKTGKFNSVHQAAHYFATEAAGSGTLPSKAERLMRRIQHPVNNSD